MHPDDEIKLSAPPEGAPAAAKGPPGDNGPARDNGPSDEVLRTEAIEGKVIDVLKTVFDPEIPVDIWELGLIYDIRVDQEGLVAIDMTLTSPACPAAGSLPPEVEYKVATIPGVKDVNVTVVWDPPWTPERMSEA